jgi:hypothetical protein
MMVLVDTPIWSLALRRRNKDLNPKEQRLTAALRELIEDGRAQLVGRYYSRKVTDMQRAGSALKACEGKRLTLRTPFGKASQNGSTGNITDTSV